jgi:hypothetical protein
MWWRESSVRGTGFAGCNLPVFPCVNMLNMKSRLILLILCCQLLLNAQTQMNLQELADFVRSELALKRSTDKQMAAEIRKIELTEKLTDKTIIDLQAQGAGPKTVDALKELRDKTKDLKKTNLAATSSPATSADSTPSSGPATATLSNQSVPVIPPPDSVTQQKILDQMKEYAMNYTSNLPNFICVEVTQQFIDPRSTENYRSLGKILARVQYKGGEESYDVYSINGKMQDKGSMSDVKGGAVSTGEFGSLMRSIFDPASSATFNWDHWGRLRGRLMAVFSYSIDSAHSTYRIHHGSDKDGEQIITAYSGLVYADADTGEVDRIKFEATDIPRSFPVKATNEILDYDLVDISGQKYVVPLSAKLFMKSEDGESKNDIEFRAYRKFGTESDIKYDMDEASKPLPASKTEEKPATPAPAKPSNPWDLPSAPPPPPPHQ